MQGVKKKSQKDKHREANFPSRYESKTTNAQNDHTISTFVMISSGSKEISSSAAENENIGFQGIARNEFIKMCTLHILFPTAKLPAW